MTNPVPQAQPTEALPHEVENAATSELQDYIAGLEADRPKMQESLTSTEGADYGGGCWLDLYGLKDGHVVPINMTSHARTPVAALNNLMEGVKHAHEMFKLNPYSPNDKAAPVQASQPAQSAVAPVTINQPQGAPISNFQNTTVTAPAPVAHLRQPRPNPRKRNQLRVGEWW